MPEIQSNNSENHLRYLDSARGIAALMVCVGHFIDKGYHNDPSSRYLFFLFNGNDAVSFFFVLSGFVLSYKYLVLNKPLDMKKFWVGRIFRLYPAFLITVIINVLFLFRNELSLQQLADIFILNKHGFWQEAILLRFHNNYYFPGWTLTFEMACSLLMPFYIILAMQHKKTIPYLFLVLLIIGNSIGYSTHFLLGMIISCNYMAIHDKNWWNSRFFKYRYWLVALAVILFSTRRIDQVYPLSDSFKYITDFLSYDFFLYSGLASFIFLAAIIQSRKARRFLETKVLVFTGKISYSIYLVHTFAINLVYAYILPHFPAQHAGPILLLFLSFMVITYLLATILHAYAEVPFMSLGKRLTYKMKPSLVFSK